MTRLMEPDHLANRARMALRRSLAKGPWDVMLTLTFPFPCLKEEQAFALFDELIFRWQARTADVRGLLRVHKFASPGLWLHSQPGPRWAGPWMDGRKRAAGRERYFVVAEPHADGGLHLHGVVRWPARLPQLECELGRHIWSDPKARGGMGMGLCRIEPVCNQARATEYVTKLVNEGAAFDCSK